jgi:hypothetical protein
MGYGGASPDVIGSPWQTAGFYVPGANPDRDSPPRNPADPPKAVKRSVAGFPASVTVDTAILNAGDYAAMRLLMEDVHDNMHGFVNMGGKHISFRDPFVFLLHSNVDRLFARWQTDPAHSERLNPDTVYGAESNLDVEVGAVTQNLNHNFEPHPGHPFAPTLLDCSFTRFDQSRWLAGLWLEDIRHQARGLPRRQSRTRDKIKGAIDQFTEVVTGDFSRFGAA